MNPQSQCAPDPVSIQQLRKLVTALNEGGIHTLEDLRLSICKDLKTGIQVVSDQTKTSKALLVALLIAEAKDDAGKKGKRQLLPYWSGLKSFRSVFALSKSEIRELLKTNGVRGWTKTRDPIAVVLKQAVARPTHLLTNWRTHWLDALIVLLPLILALLILRANSINRYNLQYVTTTAAVPAFHRISDQVENKSSPSAKGAFTRIAEVRDRYTLAPIPAGTTLQGQQLLSRELSAMMQGRKVLSVPIKASNYSATLIAPVDAILVLSPRKLDSKETPRTTLDAIVLRIEGSGETRTAIVALPEESFNVAALLLGSHDVFLSQAVP